MREHAKEHTEIPNRIGNTNAKIKIDIADLHCKICNRGMQNLEEFKEHLKTEHDTKFFPEFNDGVVPFIMKDKGPLQCAVCYETFELFSTLNKHMNGHEPSNICSHCGKSFLEKHRLEWHLLTHDNAKTYPCSQCSAVFHSRLARTNHSNQYHTTKDRYKCPYCPEAFKYYGRRLNHMKEIHNKKVEYACHLCPATFHMCNLRTKHISLVHTKIKKVTCELCSMAFMTASELKRHMVKHTGERDFKCEVCYKAYARKKTLKEHMKIHNNVRKFVCEYCNSAFVQNCSLKSHLKTHHPSAELDDKSLVTILI